MNREAVWSSDIFQSSSCSFLFFLVVVVVVGGGGDAEVKRKERSERTNAQTKKGEGRERRIAAMTHADVSCLRIRSVTVAAWPRRTDPFGKLA